MDVKITPQRTFAATAAAAKFNAAWFNFEAYLDDSRTKNRMTNDQ